MTIDQYQIVVVNLDPTIGREIKKTRPCIVISPDEMNHNLSTVVVAPLTSTKRNYPTRTKIEVEGKISRVALDQIRTIDKKRIVTVGNQISVKETLEIKSILKKTYVD
jgi:mRNA interferase MazF